MNGHGQSDKPIETERVPMKSPNKGGQPSAEEMEGRGLAKGTPHQQNMLRAQNGRVCQVRWSGYDKLLNGIRSYGSPRSFILSILSNLCVGRILLYSGTPRRESTGRHGRRTATIWRAISRI